MDAYDLQLAAATAALRTACRMFLDVPLPEDEARLGRVDVEARDMAAKLQGRLSRGGE